MKMLIVGAGVIGTVYGAHVAAAGSKVSVLSHEPRTGEVAEACLSARELLRPLPHQLGHANLNC
jgi:ketopantoate reductase